MVIDNELWDKVIARLDCIEECATHSNLRIHMIDQWIATQRPLNVKPSAMTSLVEFIVAIIPPSELEKILSGKVRPPKEEKSSD